MTISKLSHAIKALQDSDFPIAYEYRGLEDQQLWAFYTHPEYDDIYSSPFVRSPICLKADNQLTDEGKAFLEQVDEVAESWGKSIVEAVDNADEDKE